MSVKPETRELVLDRDGRRCVRCGDLVVVNFSIHHRRPRGMGGTKRPETNLPANLLTLCGSGTTDCHGWVESHRTEAYLCGLLVPQMRTPADEPVLTHRGWLFLDDNGGITPQEPEAS